MTKEAVIKKGRKFEQVIEGARMVFLRDGFEGASVDEIAREAGVSKATLYSYFPDKRVLFIEVATTECRRQADMHMAEVDLSEPPSVLLPRAGRKILDFMLSDFGQSVYRIAVAESERFPELGRKFYDTGPKLVRERLAIYLRAAVDRGELKIDDIGLAAEQFGELCKTRAFPCCLMQVGCDFSDAARQEIIDSAVAMFLARYGA